MSSLFNTEAFSEEEKNILLKYFTNVDKPVFCLINLPEVIKSALYARYSRSNKSLRRLFLDEFYSNKTELNLNNVTKGPDTTKADKLFERVFVEYGDDSVAQLGGAHIACEQASNVVAKVLEKGRLAAYLEQSTRYVYYNQKINNKYNYITPIEIQQSNLRNEYDESVANLFDTYTEIVDELIPKLKLKFPKSETQTDRAWESTLKAKACDIVRGLLPASTRTNIGIYANGQAYEMLLLKMFASSNEEVLVYASMILEELRKVIPSFLKRVDLEDRGKATSKYFRDIDLKMSEYGRKAVANNFDKVISNQVELLEWDKDAENRIVTSALFEYSELSEIELYEYCKDLSADEKEKIISSYIGQRENRRHKPGRAFEMIYYKFNILSDYGSFRDLQRHRMLTIQWQKLSPNNGYTIPEELNEYIDLKLMYSNAIEKCGSFYELLEKNVGEDIAQYVVPFAYNIRYTLNLNLREAIHIIELRTQKQGHPSYREVCLKMYNEIMTKAEHNLLLRSMKFVDFSSYSLSRLDSENKIDQKFTLNSIANELNR